MQTMDKALCDLYRAGFVSFDECLTRAIDKDNFARLAKGQAA
jgi:Tfp pilus assembly ATPase PilU